MITDTKQNLQLITILKSLIANNKNILINIGKTVIAIGLLVFLISTINPSEIIIAIKNADLYLLSVVFLMSFLNIYLQYYKWGITAETVLNEKKSKKIFYSLFYGFSAGIFTPARIGEYVGRAIVFKNKTLLQITLATLLDKIFPFLIVTFIGSIFSIMFLYLHYQISIFIIISLFVLVFLLFYFVFWLIFKDSFWKSFLFDRLQNSARINWVYEKIKVLRKLDKRYAVKMVVISLFFYLCFVIQYAILVMAFSNHNQFVDYFIAANLIMFSKTIIPPISLGELGIREGASVFFITFFGESASTGFNASIFLFLMNILIPSIIGLILLMKKNVE